ncbi:hypothetical protein NUW58_g8491 [Xylaria curta]|uniref:Uncharacterized protein n=1 Tax=Xylaria curta TaxID=42375 RepID=A0ACC1N7C4_9PEZI|nr:hypothetical protein NUW58_g8491 [Xylaria curta]
MVDNAFGIMGQLLKANSKLGGLRLRWFANFPEELPRLRLHQSYAQTIHQVLDFLIRVSQNWSIINHKHLSLGYPLLMKELVLIFRLHSPILQLIMFRASRRTLGVPDHPIGNQLDDLFKEDQEKHRNSNDGTYTLQLEGEAYDHHNNSLIQKYQALITRYQRIRPSHSPSIPAASSAAQSPGASSPSPVGSHAQAEMTQRFRPTPLPISTGRVVPSNPNAHSPSPTYSPINALHPTISPNTSAALSPQYAAAVPHVLTSSPAVGMATSSYQSTYQSPGVPQQGQYGTPNGHAQQSALQWRHGPLVPLQQQQLPQHLRQQLEQQQYYGFMLYQQQQQAQQQQRQHQAQFQQYQQQQQPQQYIHRKRSQPGAVPSSRPSPVQATRPSPSLSNPASQPSPHFQSPNSQLVSATPLRNLAPSVSAVAHQPGLVDSLSSPGAVNTVQPSNIHPRGSQRQPTQTTDRLIPPPNFRINLQDYPHTPYDKRSIESSLHQAHLRSPKRMLKLPSATNSSERYYQAIKNFALEPRPLSPRLYMHQFTFSVASVCLEKLSLNEKIEGEAQIVNRFSDGSLRIRVRCCNPPTATGPIPDHIWVICETTWPDHIFMTLNGHRLETQRKQHHSKDLPVEISSLVCVGVNTLSVSVLMPSPPRKPKPGTSYVAVEIVETLSHSAILQMVHTSGSRPASETREVIQRRLAGSRSNAAGDDHDLEMPSDGISIDLADPFTATMFKIPARGKACTHLECFDLETWLNTRLGKRSSCTCSRENCKCPKEPSLVDKWKCPICDGDARPYSLCIDQFLLEVRTRLQQDNQLRTKSITVFADGSWRVNDSPNDEESDSESDDNRTRATSKTTSKPSVPRTIIELDDD